jgi:hypothetical protein
MSHALVALLFTALSHSGGPSSLRVLAPGAAPSETLQVELSVPRRLAGSLEVDVILDPSSPALGEARARPGLRVQFGAEFLQEVPGRAGTLVLRAEEVEVALPAGLQQAEGLPLLRFIEQTQTLSAALSVGTHGETQGHSAQVAQLQQELFERFALPLYFSPLRFPEEPVGPGARWEVVTEEPDSEVRQVDTFELEQLEPSGAGRLRLQRHRMRGLRIIGSAQGVVHFQRGLPLPTAMALTARDSWQAGTVGLDGVLVDFSLDSISRVRLRSHPVQDRLPPAGMAGAQLE